MKSVLFSICMKKYGVLLAAVFCSLMMYHYGAKAKNQAIERLQEELSCLEEQKQRAASLKEELQCRIASRQDPDWIEMVLMKQLGLVPEGYMKVHFTSPKSLLEDQEEL